MKIIKELYLIINMTINILNVIGFEKSFDYLHKDATLAIYLNSFLNHTNHLFKISKIKSLESPLKTTELLIF
jgi:hypothetical protein